MHGDFSQFNHFVECCWFQPLFVFQPQTLDADPFMTFRRCSDGLKLATENDKNRVRCQDKTCMIMCIYIHILYTLNDNIYIYMRNEIDPKGPCHIYYYYYFYLLLIIIIIIIDYY